MTTRLEDLEAIAAAAQEVVDQVPFSEEQFYYAIKERWLLALRGALDTAEANAAKREQRDSLPMAGSDPTCDCPACRISRGLKPLTRQELEADGAGGEGGRR